MFSNNLYHPVKVLTHRGIIELKNINPGDYVYEYGTGKLLKVIGVTLPSRSIIHRIVYSDGRIDFVNQLNDIYIGNGIINLQLVDHLTKLSPIYQYPINFCTGTNRTLNPDPYVAGALLLYGDTNDEYLNLPYYLNGINDVLSNKYSIEYASDYIDSEGKVYFKYTGDHRNNRIVWKDFFNEDINNNKDQIIPLKYFYSSIKDRIQLIRGIFDIGYNPELFRNNTIGIVSNDENKLKLVQQILWSLGILSKVKYDYLIDPIHGNKWKLEIIDMNNGYPGLTYLIDNIEYLLSNNDKFYKKFLNTIDYVSFKDFNYTYKTNGFMSNLILEKPKALYLNDKFLPRVSE